MSKPVNYRASALLLIVASLSLAGIAHAQAKPPAIKRITIQSAWAGLGKPSDVSLVIEPAGDAYRMTGTQGDAAGGKRETLPAQTVPAAKIHSLLAAMRAPVRPTLDPAIFKPLVAHMQQQLDRWIVEMKIPEHSPVQQKVAAWREGLRRDDVLAAALVRGLVMSHTDDFPFARVEATLSDGSAISMRSDSQHFMMLPWKNQQDEPSYAAELPLALAAVLPPSIVNQQRMGRDSLRDFDLDEVLQTGLGDDGGRFRAEAAAPDAYRVLSEQFVIVSIEPVGFYGPQLDAELRLPDGPTNLTLRTRLDYKGSSLADTRQLEQLSKQLRLIQASPGMAARMRAHPEDAYRTSTFGWGSWNKPTPEQFLAQMQAMNKLPELKSHPELLRDAVLVEEGRQPAYWVVLPDRRAVLWKIYSHDKDDPAGMRCADVPMPAAMPWGGEEKAPPEDSICYGKVVDA